MVVKHANMMDGYLFFNKLCKDDGLINNGIKHEVS